MSHFMLKQSVSNKARSLDRFLYPSECNLNGVFIAIISSLKVVCSADLAELDIL